jgi:hypothetical protein
LIGVKYDTEDIIDEVNLADSKNFTGNMPAGGFYLGQYSTGL